MHILARYIFPSLICFPLVAMDVPQKTGEPGSASPLSPLRKLFAETRLIFDSQAEAECPKICVADHRIEKIAWDPHGRHLALAAYTHAGVSISIIDSSNDSINPITISNLSQWTAPELAWNKSGNLLAMGVVEQRSPHSKIVIYDVAKKVITRRFSTLDGRCLSPVVAWSPHEDTSLAVLESPDHCVRFYRIPEKSTEPVEHADPPVAFNSQGYYGDPMHLDWKKHMLAMAYARAAFCMNTETKGLGTIMPGGESGSYPCPKIACHPQKNIIAAGGMPERQGGFLGKSTPEENRFRRVALYQIDETSQPTMLATTRLDGWQNTFIRSLSFSHDGTLLIAARDDGFSIMNGETLQELLSQEHDDKTKQYLAQWNPKKKQLAFSIGTTLYLTQEHKEN